MRYEKIFYDDSEYDMIQESGVVARRMAVPAAKTFGALARQMASKKGAALAAGLAGAGMVADRKVMGPADIEYGRQQGLQQSIEAIEKNLPEITNQYIKDNPEKVRELIGDNKPTVVAPETPPETQEPTKSVFNRTNMGLAGAGLVAGATAAALLIKKAFDKKKMLYDGCDSYDTPEEIARCKNYVEKRHLEDLKKSLARCKYSNNPRECRERIQAELESIANKNSNSF